VTNTLAVLAPELDDDIDSSTLLHGQFGRNTLTLLQGFPGFFQCDLVLPMMSSKWNEPGKENWRPQRHPLQHVTPPQSMKDSVTRARVLRAVDRVFASTATRDVLQSTNNMAREVKSQVASVNANVQNSERQLYDLLVNSACSF
jgi:hypothetical protein